MKDNDCTVCLKNKISETKYPEVENPAQNILDRVHGDICGPFGTVAASGAKYFCSFIDEKSRMVKVYGLKTKDGVVAAFMDYKNFVEKQCDRKIKCIRTDNAPEYVGGDFAKILKEAGTMHQRSVAYCPQQNGIAERMNRTLVEMTRCMLDEGRVSNNMWMEALQTACYIRNRCESRAVGKSPFEIFWGIKPNMQHVRAFNCPAVAL